ncbi:hypothetical protein E1A91_D06G135000v1 [Gossypium mustelinum]|uniref:MADS-box domain-containing protein n=1 Tax=Gossypium mustelinum TaxID=34275 RepID=A0A5D2UKG7_GOSMU|nr:hypothetical protein E1A91_D06G135000v1 [Gossypium mustelinum]
MASSDKKTKGKQKIEIKIHENADDRLIKISELSTLCGGEILFIIFSPAGKPYLFGHLSVESIAKRFSNASQHLEETTDAPVETYRKERINLLVQNFNDVQDQLDALIDQLNLRELYEQDERFVEFNNLISITRDKKIAIISSMQAPMDEDVPSSFPPRYGPNLQ